MKIEDICHAVDARIKPEVETLARQVQAMAAKLEETQKLMKDEPLITVYDNGGGQKGTRENPYYPAYEKLLGVYLKSLAMLDDLMGEHAPSITDTLDELRARFKVS